MGNRLPENPMVSVIMGTYNCEDTLRLSVDSIISQTYENWEFIICDDFSTDETYSILQDYKNRYPDKFKILKNDANRKLAYSLNRCLEIAEGILIARMDGDDISEGRRFEKQVEFLRKNPDIDLVGTLMWRFGSEGISGIVPMTEFPDKFILKRRVPFAHATIMTYKTVYEKLGGYAVLKRTLRSQDYDLWFRFMEAGFKGYNIQEALYKVREDLSAFKRRTFKNRLYILQTSFIGFRKLKFPVHWYVYPLFEFMKFLVPNKLVYLMRKFQNQKRNLETVDKTTPKRVLQVIGGMDRGGAETTLMNIYRNIDRNSANFDFLVFYNKEGDYDKEIIGLGGRIIKMRINKLKGLFFSCSRFRRILRKNGPYNIIHSHIGYNSGYVQKAAKKENVPIRITHSHTSGLNKKYQGPFYKIYHSYLKKVLVKNSTDNVACSISAGLNLFGKAFLDKGKVIKNAVNIKIFHEADNSEIRKPDNSYDIDENDLVIASIARLYSVKNHAFMLEIAEELANRKFKFKMLFIGDGILRESIEKSILKKGIDNYVKLLGLRRDIPALLKDIDLIIMPSFYEGVPVSLIEAQASGVKCMVSDNITKEVDLGIGLVDYMPINMGAGIWADAVEKIEKVNLEYSEIKDAIIKSGYEVNEMIKEINDIYRLRD